MVLDIVCHPHYHSQGLDWTLWMTFMYYLIMNVVLLDTHLIHKSFLLHVFFSHFIIKVEKELLDLSTGLISRVDFVVASIWGTHC
jgi:hypothetical protein